MQCRVVSTSIKEGFMKNQLLTKVLLSICLFFVCSSGYANPVAPAFTLKTEAGETVSLSDYKGKPLILHFWATWCPYCKKLQPGLDRLHTQYKGQELEVLGISWWEDEGATPQAVLEKRGIKFKTVVNGDDVSKLYGVKGTPTTFFINRKGEVINVTRISDPNSPELEEYTKKIINSEK